MRIATVMMFCTLILIASSGNARADDKADIEKDLKKFQGAWTFESVEVGGKVDSAADFKDMTVTFEGDQFIVKKGNEVIQVGTEKIDPSKSPKTVDVTVTEGLSKGAVMLGIYEIDGDMLKVCFDPEGKKRPTEFKTAPGSQAFFNVHKRVKK